MWSRKAHTLHVRSVDMSSNSRCPCILVCAFSLSRLVTFASALQSVHPGRKMKRLQLTAKKFESQDSRRYEKA